MAGRSQEEGIEKDIEDLKALFVFAPDLAIKVHPVRIGVRYVDGRYRSDDRHLTKPMSTPNGKTIAPTGKRFAIDMMTIGHWKNGKLDHEWLFWVNQDFMNQVGLGQVGIVQARRARQ